MKIFKDFLILISFFVLSAGVYYGGAKFHVPWYGASDYGDYYKMTVEPFSNSAQSPFAYRVFTPTIAHYIQKSGFYYDSNKTPYKDNYLEHNDQSFIPSILSALIFTNYLFFSFAAFFIYKSILIKLDSVNFTERIIAIGAPSLVFLSLSTVVHGYAGLVEGASIFFISILCYLALTNNLFLFLIFAILSISQREIIPLVLSIYVSLAIGQERKISFAVTSIFAFSLYFIIKSYLQIPGHEEQTQLAQLLTNLFNFSVNKEFILQGLLANNILIYIFIVSIALGSKNYRPFLPSAMIVTILLILGIATGIENNVGRILNMAIPFMLIGIAEVIKSQKSLHQKSVSEST